MASHSELLLLFVAFKCLIVEQHFSCAWFDFLDSARLDAGRNKCLTTEEVIWATLLGDAS